MTETDLLRERLAWHLRDRLGLTFNESYVGANVVLELIHEEDRDV